MSRECMLLGLCQPPAIPVLWHQFPLAYLSGFRAGEIAIDCARLALAPLTPSNYPAAF